MGFGLGITDNIVKSNSIRRHTNTLMVLVIQWDLQRKIYSRLTAALSFKLLVCQNI